MFFFSWTCRYRLSKFSLSSSSLCLWLSHLSKMRQHVHRTHTICIVCCLHRHGNIDAHTVATLYLQQHRAYMYHHDNQPFPSAFAVFVLPVPPQEGIVMDFLQWTSRGSLYMLHAVSGSSPPRTQHSTHMDQLPIGSTAVCVHVCSCCDANLCSLVCHQCSS